jgi:NADH:ubiquinone oxidoreductase subunit 6 (subunit J)
MQSFNIVFYVFAAIIVASAALVAFSRNLVYSAFALLFTFFGVAGIYVMLSADFLAAVQLLIYVGGILVLIIFAVMLTHRISDVEISNQSLRPAQGALILIGIMAVLLGVIFKTQWSLEGQLEYQATTAPIGDLLLKKYLLPFEIVSVLLLAALMGAAVIVRKEVRGEQSGGES